MNRSHALADLASLQEQLTRLRDLQSFRSLATGLSAVVVLIAAVAQSVWIKAPEEQLLGFNLLWVSVAVSCALIVFGEMVWRSKTSPDGLLWQTHWRLTAQLLPSLIVGVLVTWQFTQHITLAVWLPESWGLIYGLGLWAATERLPPRARWAALWMIASAAISLNAGSPLAVWKMPFMFGIGQTLLCLALIPEANHHESPR